jgi:hypothetical protein
MNSSCPHKLLKKQMSGMQVWYVCANEVKLVEEGETSVLRRVGCGQKFKAVEWDGKVKVISKG